MNATAKWAMALVCSALATGCAQQQAQAPAPPPVANAPGPYDGTWVVESAAAGTGSQSISDVAACDGVQIRIEVKNNQVEGMLARSAYGGGVRQTGPGTRPITGSVQPDGTINAYWEGYTATGKLTADNKAEVRWRGTCGPRVATGGRVTSTEGAGSTGTR